MGREESISYEFPKHPWEWEYIGRRAIGRFITELELIDEAGRRILWNARRHRKGLGALTDEKRADTDASARSLNRAIACLFIVGSALFLWASISSLLDLSLPFTQDLFFFIGSLFFTLAAYLQYLQSINNGEQVAGGSEKLSRRWFAWQPHRMDFWVTTTQLVGTLCFNFNTFDSFISHTMEENLLAVWLPDILGSILFLISGFSGVVEFNHRIIFWPGRSLQSSLTVIGLWGCLLFMGSAILALMAILLPTSESIRFSLLLTGAGGLAFLSSSLLMLFER